MRLLVWHWGRRGAGPIFAAALARAIASLPGQEMRLSLAAGAEILSTPEAPPCDWAEPTYRSAAGFLRQRFAAPFSVRRVERKLRRLAPDFALCAMPALLDGRMVAALARLNIPYGVIVHDAQGHPGETLKFRVIGQDRSLRRARVLFALSTHVAAALRRAGYGQSGQGLVTLWHPPLGIAAPPRTPHGGKPRLLHFGRLLPYKGLDLLADALDLLGGELPVALRVCGDGPDSEALARLRARPDVTVERRWFTDQELPGLLGWADGLVLPYREASQSGVAALALAAGRHVLATRVGGLPEQLGASPLALLCDPDAAAIAAGLRELAASLRGPLPAADAPRDWAAFAATLLEGVAPFVRTGG